MDRTSPWWWRDPQDCHPQGDPETVVTFPSGQTVEGLTIRGVDGPMVLCIKVSADGTSVMSCATTTELVIEHLQSGPRRHADEGDGA